MSEPTFADGTPVPAAYLDRLSKLVEEACREEELYGSEEERIAHPEDWPVTRRG